MKNNDRRVKLDARASTERNNDDDRSRRLAAAEEAISNLTRVVARLSHENDVLGSEIAALKRQPALPENYIPLKTAAAGVGYSPELVRQWAVAGLVIAKKRGGVWYIDNRSLVDFSRLSLAERGARRGAPV